MSDDFPAKIGSITYDNYLRIKEFFIFSYEVIVKMLSFYGQSHLNISVVIKQIYFTGYEAVVIISILAVALGCLIILQGNILFTAFGQSRWTYMLLVSVVIRELSSVLTALIVIARSGTSICTELGNMVINSEIDLLKSYGISPISYLVVSRAIGVVVAMFTLTIIFNFVAVFGGWFLTSLFYPIFLGDYINNFINEVMIVDILLSVIKSIVFGFIIALVASYHGLKVAKSTTEVPQRTIKAVVNSIMLIMFVNILITYIYSFIQ